ncbi:MAG: ABC transporter ATP-binding protein [Candidatus Riflebacteria bacterium]|nr:ABC transporter ATP-binding protein [Candidatus Riflebacteria bacterium]
MVQLEEIRKTFPMEAGPVYALRGVNLHIKRGEMVAITGSSGSGKTTLMNILGCLSSPDSGTYRLAGEEVSNLSQQQLATIRSRRIGFVFQTFNLLPRLNALQNVELPLLYARATAGAIDRARHALERVGLADRVEHFPNQLSGGQCQRVAIARALVNEPSIILADEPTGAVDSVTSQDIMKLFHSLHAEGRTIIIVTHDQGVAAQCERQIVLKDGTVTIPGKGGNS